MNTNAEQAIHPMLVNAMKEIVQGGNCEAIYLFNDEGLVMAQYDRRQSLDQIAATELSIMMAKVQSIVKKIARLSQIKEINVEDDFGKRLIFRFVPFLEREIVLVLVVPPRKSYRGVSNDFIHALSQLEKQIAD